MNASYRTGLRVILSVVAISALLAPLVPRRNVGGPAEDLGDRPYALGSFRLTERSGRSVDQSDLADRVWIASFIFTRCPSSCPKISAIMSGLQRRLGGSRVRLVSVSVDPEYDSPEVLSAYAQRFRAEPDRWWFLTGPQAEVYRLILDRFKLSVARSSEEDRKEGAEAVSHSGRLALVDRGNRVVGTFDSQDAGAIDRLIRRARLLDRRWVLQLPAVNATLNATCGALLLAGWSLIRAGRVRGHIACMASCVAVSALFLTSYLVYHYQVGSVPFRGVGPIRVVYFTILLSHTVLAVVVVPLVALTLARALRREFAAHARIARVSFPIWLYVSVTGVLVYLMLYQLDVPTSGF